MRLNIRDKIWWVLIMMPVILVPIAIGGCVDVPSSRHAQQALVGKPETDILACAGAPRTVSSRDGLRVLSYSKGGGLLEGSFPGTKGSRPEGVPHVCTATVIVEKERVTQVEYRVTPESAGTHEHCEEIFQRCGP